MFMAGLDEGRLASGSPKDLFAGVQDRAEQGRAVCLSQLYRGRRPPDRHLPATSRRSACLRCHELYRCPSVPGQQHGARTGGLCSGLWSQAGTQSSSKLVTLPVTVSFLCSSLRLRSGSWGGDVYSIEAKDFVLSLLGPASRSNAAA